MKIILKSHLIRVKPVMVDIFQGGVGQAVLAGLARRVAGGGGGHGQSVRAESENNLNSIKFEINPYAAFLPRRLKHVSTRRSIIPNRTKLRGTSFYT